VLSEDFPALAGFRAGSLLAGYRLEAQVGMGGMGLVFRARDERLGRLVALKILAPALTADSAFRRRFIAESRAAAAVDDPHIIPIYEAGEAEGALFIAMRFVQGGDLRRVLDGEGPLPPDWAVEFISQVASALDAAHGAGLVHRDVKPANILVDARVGRPDHVYLSDFGVSKGATSSASLTGTGQFLGTPDYSAPEQIQGRAVDGRTDQYALACVAYQLLTGEVPFERDQGMAVLLAHLSEPPPSLSSRRTDLPAAADQVLARGMAKAPEKRYASCGDFAGALREALGLAPYRLRRSAATPDHPSTMIASQPVFPERSTDGAGKAAVPVDLAIAATMDAVPRGGSPDVPGLSAGAAIASGLADPGARPEAAPPITPAMAQEDSPATVTTASVADVYPAGQRPVPFAGEAAPTRRPRHLLPIALAAAVVAAAAIAVPLLASSHNSQNSPGSQDSPSLRSSPSLPVSPSTPGGTVAATLTDPGGLVNTVAFSPSGATLAAAVGGTHGGIYLWDIASGKLAATLTNPGGGADSVAFSPSGATLAAADQDGSTYLWTIASRTVAATLTDPGGLGVASVAFSPSGATLATAGGYSDRIYLWNIASGKLAATLTDPGGGGVTSLAFSPDGATLATAGGNIYLWNIASRKLAGTLTDPGGGNSVYSVAFSPSGATLAAADADNASTYMLNIASGKLAATLTDPGGDSVESVAFSPGGATLATAGGHNGSTTYLWKIG
jgi:serine/threonine protein kinase/sugar lactone lactonase YvrE